MLNIFFISASNCPKSSKKLIFIWFGSLLNKSSIVIFQKIITIEAISIVFIRKRSIEFRSGDRGLCCPQVRRKQHEETVYDILVLHLNDFHCKYFKWSEYLLALHWSNAAFSTDSNKKTNHWTLSASVFHQSVII